MCGHLLTKVHWLNWTYKTKLLQMLNCTLSMAFPTSVENASRCWHWKEQEVPEKESSEKVLHSVNWRKFSSPHGGQKMTVSSYSLEAQMQKDIWGSSVVSGRVLCKGSVSQVRNYPEETKGTQNIQKFWLLPHLCFLPCFHMPQSNAVVAGLELLMASESAEPTDGSSEGHHVSGLGGRWNLFQECFRGPE